MDINFRRQRREINLLSNLLELDVLYEHKVGPTSGSSDFSDYRKLGMTSLAMRSTCSSAQEGGRPGGTAQP